MASYPQYTQQYVVAPAPATTQTYAAPAPAYDPQAYSGGHAQPYQAAPAPHYAPAPQYGAPAYNRDELRTIFVTGFPPDMKERELSNMCRFLPGYEAVSMKASTHGAPQGFVLFQYGHNAMHACTCFNGCEFDTGCYLRAEMARKNMYVRGGDERPAKAYRADGPPAGGGGGGPPVGGGGGAPHHYGGPPPGAPAGSFQDRNQTNPPCNTLFIGNLSPHVDDGAIEAYFRNVKGDAFVTCKVNRSNPSRVSAFVQFADLAAAAEVHDGQQGKEMPGSDRGPMRIQYSRNPLGEFGKRRREEAASGGYGFGGPPAMHMQAPPHHGGAGGTPTPGADAGQYAVAPADGGAGPGYAAQAPPPGAPPGQPGPAAPPADYSHAPPPQQPQ